MWRRAAVASGVSFYVFSKNFVCLICLVRWSLIVRHLSLVLSWSDRPSFVVSSGVVSELFFVCVSWLRVRISVGFHTLSHDLLCSLRIGMCSLVCAVLCRSHPAAFLLFLVGIDFS